MGHVSLTDAVGQELLRHQIFLRKKLWWSFCSCRRMIMTMVSSPHLNLMDAMTSWYLRRTAQSTNFACCQHCVQTHLQVVMGKLTPSEYVE